ncbi:MAG: YkgJ family cysteine cluster protein [Candidatus Bathyarchaeota archaeon]|nr:YkgJ family cysteine cluster protein [Candidatus Bathyarchaeota archaeon]
MPEDNKGKTYSYDVCSECGIICCIDAKPPLTENRKKIIKQYLKENSITVSMPFTTKEYSYPSVDEASRCVFNDKTTKRCMIHPVKPETCVAGPITFDINFATKKVQFFLKKSNICAYAGDLYKDQTTLQTHFEVAKKQILVLVKELSANELRELNKIDEPETFKISEEELPKEVTEKLGL